MRRNRTARARHYVQPRSHAPCLARSAFHGHAQLVSGLLAAGVDANATTTYGKTALDYARFNLQHACIAVLMVRPAPGSAPPPSGLARGLAFHRHSSAAPACLRP